MPRSICRWTSLSRSWTPGLGAAHPPLQHRPLRDDHHRIADLCCSIHAEVDAAAVLVNASSRFVDGGEFGFGAEIGISTQKLHARGPMGLPEMTSTKYVVTGSGQVRP